MPVTVRNLLSRGDELSIQRGRLVILPASGRPIPKKWLQVHWLGLAQEILTTIGLEAYEYESYKTGHYGDRKLPGITLQFLPVAAGKNAHTIFNANLTRLRTTESGDAGSPLPEGHFSVGKRSHFYSFWISTGLAVPKSLTSFHDFMGKLRGILFTAEWTEGRENRMDAGTPRPLSISAEIVRNAFLPDNARTAHGQRPDNIQIRMPDKDSAQAQENRGLQVKPTTCSDNCGKAVIRKRDDKGADSLCLQRPTPQEQHWEDWLEDYSRPDNQPQT